MICLNCWRGKDVTTYHVQEFYDGEWVYYAESESVFSNTFNNKKDAIAYCKQAEIKDSKTRKKLEEKYNNSLRKGKFRVVGYIKKIFYNGEKEEKR